MKPLAMLIASGLIAAGATGACAATVDVNFVAPDHYADANRYARLSAPRQEKILAEIRAHIQGLGERYLGKDETLRIEVLDIDLAGEFDQSFGPAADIRVMRSSTVPRMEIRYELLQGGRVIVGGEEHVTDLGYLDAIGGGYRNENLKYEKQMLTNWFVARFVDRKPPRV